MKTKENEVKNMELSKWITPEQVEYLKLEIDDKIEEKIKILNKLRNNNKSASARFDEIDRDVDMLYRMQMLIKNLKNK